MIKLLLMFPAFTGFRVVMIPSIVWRIHCISSAPSALKSLTLDLGKRVRVEKFYLLLACRRTGTETTLELLMDRLYCI